MRRPEVGGESWCIETFAIHVLYIRSFALEILTSHSTVVFNYPLYR